MTEQLDRTATGDASSRSACPGSVTARTKDAERLVRALELHQCELKAQKQELEEAWNATRVTLDHYTDFYDSAPVGFLTLDRIGDIRQLNVTLAGMLGGERLLLLNKHFARFIDAADRRTFYSFLEQIFSRGSQASCEVRLHAPDGDGAFVQIDATRGKTGQTCSAVVVDITERRQAELLLKNHRDQLEAAVAESTAELRAANQELQSFTYAVSHDLKGPLGRINAFSLLLEQRCREVLDGDGQQCLDFIRQNTSRLTHLVDELLNHAVATQQNLERQPVDIQALIQATVNEHLEVIRERRTEVEVKLTPVRVMADPRSLYQVFTNLLENALKYSSPAPQPQVEIGGEQVGGSYRLWVRDNGIGFDMQYHDQIFDIFRRLHSYNEIPGSGVGLALVKKAMDRMQGRVWAESEPGQGATFFLELPVATS